MSDVVTMQKAVLAVGARLQDNGLLVGPEGGLSARAGRNIIIAPSGVDRHVLTVADLTVVHLVSGFWTGPKPPAEMQLHLAIYRKRKQVGAVVRLDSPFVSTVAAARREVPPVLEELAQIAGPTVRLANPTPPSPDEMVRAALKALRRRMAALLASHGAVCLGRDLDEALLCCEVMERGCRTFVEAQFLGGAKQLSRLEAFVMHHYYLRRYSKVWKERHP